MNHSLFIPVDNKPEGAQADHALHVFWSTTNRKANE